MKKTITAILLFCAFGLSAQAQTYTPTCLTPAQITTVTQSTAALAPILLFDETDAALRLADAQCANVKMAMALLADMAQAKADIAALKAIAPVPGPQGIPGSKGDKGDKGDPGAAGIPGPAGAASPTAPMSDFLLANSLGNIASWAMTAAPSEFVGTRRILSLDNVHALRFCINGGGAGVGSTMSAETVSYNSSGGEVISTLAGPLDISALAVPHCTAWTPYSGPGGDALVRIRGQSPTPAPCPPTGGPGPGCAQFYSITLQAR